MKLYAIRSDLDVSSDGTRFDKFEEFVSSSAAAAATRARLKKLGHQIIDTNEYEIETTKAGLIKFLNQRTAEPTWVVPAVTEKLGG